MTITIPRLASCNNTNKDPKKQENKRVQKFSFDLIFFLLFCNWIWSLPKQSIQTPPSPHLAAFGGPLLPGLIARRRPRRWALGPRVSDATVELMESLQLVMQSSLGLLQSSVGWGSQVKAKMLPFYLFEFLALVLELQQSGGLDFHPRIGFFIHGKVSLCTKHMPRMKWTTLGSYSPVKDTCIAESQPRNRSQRKMWWPPEVFLPTVKRVENCAFAFKPRRKEKWCNKLRIAVKLLGLPSGHKCSWLSRQSAFHMLIMRCVSLFSCLSDRSINLYLSST